MKMAINGYGRIGRCFLRILQERGLLGKEIEIVAVNDLGTMDTAAYLTKYDTVHGTLKAEVTKKEKSIEIDGLEVPFICEPDAAKLPWAARGVDIVVECSGAYATVDRARLHLKAGAKKSFVSAPAKGEGDDFITMVYGVNHEKYDPAKHHVISNGSCTTNCLAPVAKVLHEKFGIERGFMTTIHAYTNDQLILDVAHRKELRRSRAAAANMIPTTTGAAKALGLVLPALKGKLDGLSVRVPIPCGSLVDLNVVLAKAATKEEINAALKNAAAKELKGVMLYTDDPIVSSDAVHTSYSSIVDGLCTNSIGNLSKVMAWYDNEWGFSNRMVDMCEKVLSKGL